MLLRLLLSLLLTVSASAQTIVDLDGVTHRYDGRNLLVVIGNTNCPPMDSMLRYQIAAIRADYPDVEGLVLFPCATPAPETVRAWQRRVGATNFTVAEMSYFQWPQPQFLSDWFKSGAPAYGGGIYCKGRCETNWPFYRYRWQLEPVLTRQLLDLRVNRGDGSPVISWRTTKLDWQLRQTNTFFWLELPNQ